MTLLKGWWRWFGRQSRLNKVVIVGFSAALVFFLVPVVVSWFKPPPIHVGVAFYTYERAFLLEGNTKAYFYENRNLVSDCSLRRIEQTLPKGRAKTPDPQSWVVIKFLLENMSDQSITKFRMSIKSPLVRPTTTLFTTPNVEATGAWETMATDAPHMYVISIAAIAPMASAVHQLEDSHRRNIASVCLYGSWSGDYPGAFSVGGPVRDVSTQNISHQCHEDFEPGECSADR